jgi:two-component system, LuxR family, sensor kinase FixL
VTRLGLKVPCNTRISDIAQPRLFLRPTGFASKGAVAAAFFAAYVALEWISAIHEYKGVPITPWNPGLGVVFTLMVLAGARGAFVLFAGVLCAEIFVLRSDLEWPIVIGIGVSTSSSYALVAGALRRYFRLDAALSHLRDVLILLAAGLGGAVISAVVLDALLVASENLDIRDVIHAALPLLVGDVIGIAVMTPLGLRLALRRRVMIAPDRLIGPASEGVVYIVVITVGLSVVTGTGSTDGFKFFYLLFLPVVMAAVRHGLDGACVVLAVTQLGLVGLARLRGYDAEAFTELQVRMFVLTATGLIVGVIVSERRNSDRRAREAEARLKEKEAVAAQAARFNLVSGLASAVAHEINQPMTAVRALARSVQHILSTPGGDLERARANMTTMIAQVDHASEVVRRVREFIRRGRLQIGVLDVRSMLEEALTLIRPQGSANGVRIELDVPADLPSIQGDRVQLEQVVLNLVRNAIEALVVKRQDGGCIQITARAYDAPARLEVGVMDNGPGVDDDVAERLFVPLTTSKDEGLGLGLAICVSIVESHGGRLWLESRQAGATEFRFSLPLDQSRV